MTARFDRTAQEPLEKLLLPGGPLHMLAVAPGRLNSARVPLVAHLRADRMTIYAGLTKLLQIRVAGAGLTVSATAAYARQPCAHDLVGTYPLTEAGQIVRAARAAS